MFQFKIQSPRLFVCQRNKTGQVLTIKLYRENFLQLYEAIRPGIVDWKRVVKQFRKLQSM